MTVSLRVEAEIRRLHFAEHWPVGTIARQLTVHEDVVRRVLGLLQPRKSPRLRPTLVGPYADFIQETLGLYPRLRATRLYDMARERGYPGSVRTLRDFVARVRPVPKSEAYLRLDPLLGEQAQVDWAHVAQVPVPGGTRSLWLFVMVLAWSRALWGEFVFDLDVHSLLRSLVRASAYFGGTTRQWLFDNPKTVVLERFGDAVRFHPALVDLSGRYHVQLRVCEVRAANQKGRVERAIRYLRDRFLAGRTLAGVQTGNEALLRFLREVALQRPHPTQPNRTVEECLTEERVKLLPLPEASPPTELVTSVYVDKTAFLRFDTNRYSVPPAYADRTLTLAADDRELRVLDQGEQVARHERSFGRRQIFEDPSHREELLRQRQKARPGKSRDLLLAVAPRASDLFAAWSEAGRNLGNAVAQTRRLLDLYGPDLFRRALDELLARHISDPGALAQICEQERRRAGQPPPAALVLGPHVPDRGVTPHSLESYDEKLRRPR